MKMQKSPWYKNPYWLGGIALGVVVIALVLFLALRGGEDKKNCRAVNAPLDSMVTRVYSGAGQMRTAMMVAPRAMCC